MTKEIYNIQRQKLMDDAQKLLDESKTAEAQAKMKEVEALDAKFEEEAKIQANLNALAGQKVAAPAAAAQSVDLSGTAKTPDVLDRYDTDEYKRAFMNYVLTGKKIQEAGAKGLELNVYYIPTDMIGNQQKLMGGGSDA